MWCVCVLGCSVCDVDANEHSAVAQRIVLAV